MNLLTLVSEQKKDKLVSSDCASILETTFSGVPKELLKRLVMQKEKKNPDKYLKKLRTFAVTLKFYSVHGGL